MRKYITIFGVILSATILISSCGNENSSNTSELKDISKKDSTAIINSNEPEQICFLDIKSFIFSILAKILFRAFNFT